MIDFENAKFFKLKTVDNDSYDKVLSPLLTEGEQVVAAFKSIRDGVVFTDKRIIAISVEGVTGTKKDITSLPYNKIQLFSIETAGFMDVDCELEVWFSTLGKLRFEFLRGADIGKICRVISDGCI